MGKKLYYIDGVTIAIAKKICKFFFEDSFDRAEKNEKEKTYDIFLIKPKDEDELNDLKDDIEYFLDFWGNQYKFYFSENK